MSIEDDKIIVPVYGSGGERGEGRLAVTALLAEKDLIVGFEAVDSGNPVAYSLMGPNASIREIPSRAVHTPSIHFRDTEYPRVAVAHRVVDALLGVTFRSAGVHPSLAIEPLTTRAGESRLIIESRPSGAQAVQVEGEGYTAKPGEIGVSGLVAVYNALFRADAVEIASYTLPSGHGAAFPPVVQA